jgi:hypothetical protein
MRSEVRGESGLRKLNITIAVFDGAHPYRNYRMELITRPRTGTRSHSFWYSTQTMCILNDSTLSYMGRESEGKRFARTETVCRFQRSHDRPSAPSAKPFLNMFLYRCIQYEFETRGCLF